MKRFRLLQIGQARTRLGAFLFFRDFGIGDGLL